MDIDLDSALSKRTIIFGLKLWILICIGIGVIFIVILCFFSSWVASKKNKRSRSLIGRNPSSVPVSRSALEQESIPSNGIAVANGNLRSNALQDVKHRIDEGGLDSYSVSQRLEKALKEHRCNNNSVRQPNLEDHGQRKEPGLSPFLQESSDVNGLRQERLMPNLQDYMYENGFQREGFNPFFQDHREMNRFRKERLSPFYRNHGHDNGLSPFFQEHRHENGLFRQEGLRPFDMKKRPPIGMNDHIMIDGHGHIDRGVEENINGLTDNPECVGSSSLPMRVSPMPGVSHLGWGHWYTLRELEIATNSFSYENVLGEGSYGIVYWGQLPDGTRVAVKNLLNNRGQAEREFKREVTAIGRVRHKNLVRLIGYCMECSQRLLVYEYIDNGNLEQWLHGVKLGDYPPLSWDIRMKIVLGTAKALAYLHEGLEPKIVHRDIKSSNILLDNRWNPKVADFGLAKLLGTENSHVTTRVMGTFGYVAPEYALTGMLTEKSDVYSYGVLLMEVLTGRVPVDFRRPSREVNLVVWLKSMVANHQYEDVLDPKMDVKPPLRTLKQVLAIAIQCVDSDVYKRPKMGQVLHLLEDDNYPFQEMDRKNIYCSLRSNNTPIGTNTSNHMKKSSQIVASTPTNTSNHMKKSSQIVASTPIDVETRRNITSGKCKALSEEHHEDAIDLTPIGGPRYEEG